MISLTGITALSIRPALAVNALAAFGSAGTCLGRSAFALVAALAVTWAAATVLAAVATAVARLAVLRLAAPWLTVIVMTTAVVDADTNQSGDGDASQYAQETTEKTLHGILLKLMVYKKQAKNWFLAVYLYV